MSTVIHIDQRGYCLLLHHDGTYSAGCHKRLTRDEALAHWGAADYPIPEIGAGFVSAIKRGEEVVECPAGLRGVVLHDNTTLPDGLVLPAGLRGVVLHDNTTLPDGLVLPAGLQWIILHGSATLPARLALPKRLLWIELHGNATLPDGLVLPAGLRVIELHDNATLPDGLTTNINGG